MQACLNQVSEVKRTAFSRGEVSSLKWLIVHWLSEEFCSYLPSVTLDEQLVMIGVFDKSFPVQKMFLLASSLNEAHPLLGAANTPQTRDYTRHIAKKSHS